MKGERTMTMSKPQQERYIYYTVHDTRADKDSYYSTSDIKAFRALTNRISPVIASYDNRYELASDLRHHFAGEPLANGNALAMYILTRYKRTQTTLTRILDSISPYAATGHYYDAQCMLNGMTIRYPDAIHATFTNDLETVTVKM
jgi:hypothetical protein